MSGRARAHRQPVSRTAWRPRIGLAIASDTIRVVEWRRGRIRWTLECPIEPDAGLDKQIVSLFARAPRGGLDWPSPNVVAAIGPTGVQVKRVSGLPPLREIRTLSVLLRESASRFFISKSSSLVTGNAEVLPSGDVWGSAFDGGIVNAVVAGCREANARLVAIVPTVAVLPLAVDDDEIPWVDGDSHLVVRANQHRFTDLRREAPRPPSLEQSRASAREAPTWESGEALATLGAGLERFADAVGAALVTPPNLRLAIDLHAALGWRGPVSTGRATLAVVVVMLAVVWAAIAPGLSGMRAEAVAEAHLEELAARRLEASLTAAHLEQVTAALRDAGAAEIGRREPLELLAALTESLPDGTALVTIRLDSVGGSFVVLGPSAAPILARVDSVAMITGSEIVGPVTRETVGGRELERLAIRFQLATPHRSIGVEARPAPTATSSGASVRGIPR